MKNFFGLLLFTLSFMNITAARSEQPIIFSTIMQGNNGVAIDLRIEVIELVFRSCEQWGGNFDIKFSYEFKAYRNGQPIAYEFWNANGSTLSIDGFGNKYQIFFPKKIPIDGVSKIVKTGNDQSIREPYPCDKYNINNIGITALNIYFTGPDFNNSNNKITLTPDVVLPITLSDFSVKCQGNYVDIFWKTMTERNVSHYEIYTSKGGRNWELLNTVSAVGNSTIPVEYQIKDNFPSPYYKLVSVDFNGYTEEFGPISNSCTVTKSEVSVYPNPFREELNIKGLNVSEVNNVNVFNNLGVLVLSEEVYTTTGQHTLFMNANAGLYFIQVNDAPLLKLIKN